MVAVFVGECYWSISVIMMGGQQEIVCGYQVPTEGFILSVLLSQISQHPYSWAPETSNYIVFSPSEVTHLTVKPPKSSL